MITVTYPDYLDQKLNEFAPSYLKGPRRASQRVEWAVLGFLGLDQSAQPAVGGKRRSPSGDSDPNDEIDSTSKSTDSAAQTEAS